MGSIVCDMGMPFVSALVYVPDDCLYKARNGYGQIKYFPCPVLAIQWLRGEIY